MKRKCQRCHKEFEMTFYKWLRNILEDEANICFDREPYRLTYRLCNDCLEYFSSIRKRFFKFQQLINGKTTNIMVTTNAFSKEEAEKEIKESWTGKEYSFKYIGEVEAEK